MQRRELVRARGLAAFRRALVDRALAGDPPDVRRRAVVVPTRAAAELLRQTMEQSAAATGRQAIVLPDLVTRDELFARLAASLAGGAPPLSRIEREVMLARAADRAADRHPGAAPPFERRPGLVAAMLDFYDELRRRQRTTRRFVGALFAELGGARELDRGSDSLIRQTAFFGYAFLGYERAMRASGRFDEHACRDRLLAEQPPLPYDALVVGVADHPSDPRGLWPADYDLVGRLAGLSSLEVIVTEEAHDAGFRQRIEMQLPGIDEVRAPDVPRAPRVQRHPGDRMPTVRVCRDREDELRTVARRIRSRAAEDGGRLTTPTAVVFQRPLPYLYLAHQVLVDARVPYQTFDALPLAVEPYAAFVDLVLDVARTAGTRDNVTALLRSTLLGGVDGADPLEAADVSALDRVLAERRATGEAATYAREVATFFGGRGGRDREPGTGDRGPGTGDRGPGTGNRGQGSGGGEQGTGDLRAVRRGVESSRAERAARAAGAVAGALAPFRTAGAASAQVATVAEFLRAHERLASGDEAAADRQRRARTAVLAVLDELASAFARHDDRPRHPDALSALIHHVIEARTFTPRRGHAGVHLVDAVAARFGEFDRVHLVGLVDTDWPERSRRNMFYSTGLLRALGWPDQPEQARAEQAAFRDVLDLARSTTSATAFQLEGDSVVGLSPLVELLRERPLTDDVEEAGAVEFVDEQLAHGEVPGGLDSETDGWAALRLARPALSDARYAGSVDPQAPSAYRVSRVDRYVDCPFKYFAEAVLQLREERDEMAGLTPIERGTLLHTLFERFYREWQSSGRGAITAESLPDALTMFSASAADEMARLPEADRALEGTRLLGSIVGSGVAERVFELEVDAGVEVRTRLLEQPIEGSFVFPVLGGLGQRAVEIRGKADRIDVLTDGSLRVIDYKLGRMPDLKQSIQIAVYAHAAQQMLEAADGQPHPIAGAAYLAFGDDRKLEGRIGGSRDPVPQAVLARVASFAAVISDIEAGRFAPDPKHPGECQWCGFKGVCRKEYRIENDDEAADAV
jgi:RecB family exonuclease